MEASGWGGAGVPSTVEVGQVSPVPQSFFVPLGLMFCHESGGSVSPDWENLKSPHFSVPLFFHTLWTIPPFPSPPLLFLFLSRFPFPTPLPSFFHISPYQPSGMDWDPAPAGFP